MVEVDRKKQVLVMKDRVMSENFNSHFRDGQLTYYTLFLDGPLKVILVVLAPVLATWTTANVGSLHTALLTGYDTTIRPSELTTINLEFGIAALNELDIVAQKIAISGFLKADWNDSRLSWTPSSYNDINNTFMYLSQVWTPPLVLSNAAEAIVLMNDNSDIASAPLKIDYSGSILWLIPSEFEAACDAKIGVYPFDQQTCSFVVTSWLYDTYEVFVTLGPPAINFDLFEENGEWAYTSSEVIVTVRSIHGHSNPGVKFQLTFTRRTAYYVINMLLPVILLSALGCVVFLLPVESGEKNGYALTILLSLSVVLSIVAASIPTTSTQISILSMYLLVAFTVCAFEVLATALTVRWYNFDSVGYKLSARMQRLMKTKLVPLTRYKRSNEVDCASSDTDTQATELTEIDADAWKEKSKSEEEMEELFSYKDFAVVIDIFNFYMFSTITFLLNFICLIVLTCS